MIQLAARQIHPQFTSAQDDNILCSLASHFLLTASQLRRLCGYSPRSIRLLRARLRVLEHTRYIRAYPAPRASENGRAPRIYLLADRGRRYVASLGIDVPRRHRPSEPGHYGYQAIQHSIAVSDFLIAAQLLNQLAASIVLQEFLHERTLTRQLRRSPVVPDGWLDFHVAGRRGSYRSCFALEIDRGFHRQAAWRRKIAAILAWTSPGGLYQQQFGTPSLTVLVVATRAGWSDPERAKRRDQLRAWTEAELESQSADVVTDLFRFTAIDPSTGSPEELFLRPNWFRPDSNRRALPLFDEVTPAPA